MTTTIDTDEFESYDEDLDSENIVDGVVKKRVPVVLNGTTNIDFEGRLSELKYRVVGTEIYALYSYVPANSEDSACGSVSLITYDGVTIHSNIEQEEELARWWDTLPVQVISTGGTDYTVTPYSNED